MRKKQSRFSKPVVVSVFLLIGIIFLFLPKRMSSKFHDIFVYIFSPVLKISAPYNFSSITESALEKDYVSKEKYDLILQKNLELEKQLKQAIRARNQTLEMLETVSGTRQRLPDIGPGHIWAEIITKALQRSELDINRGKNDGLKEGQYVIANDNVIGTIWQVFNYTAKVKLLTDIDHKMIVEVEGLDQDNQQVYIRAFMKGDGKGLCTIGEIKTSYKIEQGNFVYAYARPGYLNAPLVIGKVLQIFHDDSNPLFWKIIVRPLMDINNIDRVFAISMEPYERQ